MDEEKKSQVSLVVDIVSPERAWTMFAAAALAPTKSAAEAAEIADTLMGEFLARFRGGAQGDVEGDEDDADAESEGGKAGVKAEKSAKQGATSNLSASAAKPKAAPMNTSPIMGDDDDDFPLTHMPALPAAKVRR